MTTIEPTTEMAVLKTDSRGRVLTSAQQRKRLLDALEQSGMSAAAFDRLHGINWRQKRERHRHHESQTSADEAFFEEVHFRPKDTAGLKVALPGEASVKIERADQFPMVAFFHDVEADADGMARMTLRNPDSGMAM